MPLIQEHHHLHTTLDPPPQPPTFGLVRPNEHPFEFEVSLGPRRVHALPRPAPVRPPPPPAPAPPSHHVPNMGFGGAILSLNRQNAIEQHLEQERSRDRQLARMQNIFRRVSSYLPYWRSVIDRGEADELLDAALAESLIDPVWGDVTGVSEDGDAFGSHFRRVQQGYKSIYTHPLPPAEGFTHNFAHSVPKSSPTDVIVLDEDEPSASASGTSSSCDVSMMLVCASCLDPLYLAGGALSDEERAKSKVWGLRCGHMLDGKCVAKLMQPLDLEKDGVELGDGRPCDEEVSKGKGKSKARTSIDQATSNDSIGSTPPIAMQEHTTQSNTASNSVRSRLRPRNMAGLVLHASAPSSGRDTRSVNPPQTHLGHRPHPRPAYSVYGPSSSATPSSGSNARAKGKGKVVAPRIEAEHEWRCPVPKCGHLHSSINVEGKGWMMDENRGAVGVFA